MHLKRQEAITKLPIPRKGTKYIARALSDIQNAVPVVIAVRDMLKLARTAKEVNGLIHRKMLKINGRVVRNKRESIKLFNLFEADKTYFLSLLPTGKFFFEEAKHKDIRLCKVINRTSIKNNLIQVNLHDGSNVISKDKILVGDSLYIDLEGKIKKHLTLEKGKEAMVIKGKYMGLKGKIDSSKENKVVIHLKDKLVTLDKMGVISI